MRLSRNRDFLLFQTGQLLSSAGSSVSAIAYPLLVLSLTHSPAKAGLVGFAALLPTPLLGLVAGVAADRYDRRRIMLTADVLRAAVVAAIAIVVVTTSAYYPIPVLAFVSGVGDVFFYACSFGVVRNVVPPEQLPDAISVQTARAATVGIVGPPLGGALFGIARVVPFVADAISYSFSFLSLAAIRAPFQEEREAAPRHLRAELAEGFAFLWRQPFLRATSFLYAVGNLTEPAILFILVVDARRHGLSGGEIGLLLGVFAACLLAGSGLAPLARRRLSVRAIVLCELYLGIVVAAFVVWPNVYVLAAAILPQAVVFPVTDSVVFARRIAVTPDRLLGRVDAVRQLIARTAQPLGPLVAGVAISVASPRVAVAAFAALNLATALVGTRVRSLNS
jgi:MFS family permease